MTAVTNLRPTEGTTAPDRASSAESFDATEIRDLLRDAISGVEEPGPEPLAMAVLPMLDADQVLVAAYYGLKHMSRQLIGGQRRGEHAPPTPRPNLRPVNGSGKWAAVAEAEREHPDVMLHQIAVARDGDGKYRWEFLGECKASDLAGAESLMREQASGVLRSIKRLEQLRGALSGPRQKVKALGHQTVREIWDA